MRGRGPPFPAGGHGRTPRPQQQPSPSPQHVNTDLSQQDPNLLLQNLANALLLNSIQQNFNFPFQNPIFPIQNPHALPPQQQYTNNFPYQQPPQAQKLPPPNSNQVNQKPSEATTSAQQQQKHKQPKYSRKPAIISQGTREPLERIEKAVENAQRDILAAEENVSAWKISKQVLLALQVDSWESLGFRMQEVPPLHRLIVTEGKINAFINCFVAVRRIVSVYDLEVAICANEGVEHFEELRLGPLMRHPLVLHYFSVDSDATKVFKITSEEVIIELGKFLRKKRAITVDKLLDLLAERRSVKRKETLGLRIQSLGMHIGFLRDAVESELTTLKKCKNGLESIGYEIEKSSRCEDEMSKKSPGSSERTSDHKRRKRPLFSSQKNYLDKRFVAVHKRVKSFYSTDQKFCGKHIRFVSSESEDEESDDSMYEINTANNDVGGSVLSPQNAGSSERVSSCPYPSATEERSRLGLKSEMSAQSSQASGRNGLFGKKRKLKDGSWVVSMHSKLYSDEERKNASPLLENCDKSGTTDAKVEEDLLLCDDNIATFVTTWKSTCEEHTVSEVLEKMLQYYGPQQTRHAARFRKMVKNVFCSSPFIDLFNVAVKSIKCGMWDSIYDTLQALGQLESTATRSPKCSEYESIDVVPTEKLAPVVSHHGEQQPHAVTLEELMAKVAKYYELDHSCQSTGKSSLEEKLMSLSKLCDCGSWLADQFGVKDFKSLGYGEFFKFLTHNVSLIPAKLQKLLSGDLYGKSPLEVAMLWHQLVVLASQASNQQNVAICRQMISQLITRQFPLLCFKVMDNGSIEDFLQAVEEYKNNVISKCVLFSATLFGMDDTTDSSSPEEDCILVTTEVRTSSHRKPTAFKSISSKNVVDVLLRAPMLSDLNLWSHWDRVFAPTLGPLVGWLLREVNAKDLLCIVTKDSRVIRIDHAATDNSFLEAALRGSSFDTAVQLLSLFSVAGGEKHAPLSLLKCHACKAFEIFLEDLSVNMEAENSRSYILHGKSFGGVAISNSHGRSAASVASRFVLDCLGYMPLEFHAFAADVLLAGMQSLVKEAPSAILYECNHKERLLLHEIGLSIGIVEWVNDYHAFCATGMTDVMSFGQSCTEATGSECLGFRHVQSELISSDIRATSITPSENADTEECLQVSCSVGGAVVSINGSANDSMGKMSVINEDRDAALVIESIRKEEFGLDPHLSSQESSILKKQHARLGRALHCLSQELYSQDSHFVLELVQNADDNNYPENEEPTLAFILQESGIVIMNNELGFSAENIKALCDVGNSTKKGSNGGYIGQKGIGFKSVFRITDAPEIHSNGFHVKFDIGDGQIGFVLPTAIPPCNIGNFSRLVMREDDYMDSKCWKTCIVLPFRSKLSEETAMQMFSDLHPSLLLFLHRLKCIMFQNTLNGSPIVMRKEILDDGIVKVSHGEDKMTWLVASQKLQAHVSRPKVQATEIAIAFTLAESGHGTYTPCVDQQPVFAFLPLRTYGLKFILQGDFVLTSSREEVDRNNPWNEWLLTKFPGLFITAERSFFSLSCFKDNPGKAVAAYLSYVPLIGEVHGFFAGLPRAIILELRRSSCLLLEGDSSKLIPPCNAMRCWDEQARNLLPDNLLHEHLGLGFLDKNIVLPDSVAKALGIAEYGPEILVRFMACLCLQENGLIAMGMGWLSSWLNTLYRMISHSTGQIDLINSLHSIPFIPLSDGSYSSVDAGAIWLQSDASRTGFDGALGFEAFPKLYAKLRTVNPALLSASAVDEAQADNVTGMLHIIGIQNLSAHEIMKLHILQAMCDDRIASMDKTLITDYLCFLMIHLQSNCTHCCHERTQIISELQKKAYILTNYGYKRIVEIPIHFSKEFGNPVDVNRLITGLNMQWHEVDSCYLKHPANESLANRVMKWREFLHEIGVTDFVQVIQVDKSVGDLSCTILNGIIRNSDVIPPGLMAGDWESPELVSLLSRLSGSGNSECCKYLLEVLDTLWEGNFSDKTTGYCYLKSSGNDQPFRSSFMMKICDVRWVVSGMDDTLHYPKDLFHSCDAVQSILGSSAPYALPKVRSTKLLNDIGFKTEVSINDALDVLEVWRKSEVPFKTSISQMSKFYSFIWGEMAASRNNIVRVFHSGPFIFVPCTFTSRHEVLVSGFFFSAEEVFWHDPTGSVNLMRKICPLSSLTREIQCSISKTLCNIYPGLHDFFVNECGVCETPSCRVYLHMLHQLSSVALPSQAAGVVFQIFLRWTESHKSGLLSYDDIKHLRECLVKVEYTVLPTIRDKWVSLHPSFGLLCWCDDQKLKKIFKDLDDVHFLYFGDLSDDEQAVLRTKVSILMETLGIPSLSEVTTREAICDGQADCSLKASLVNWALPYAQRYMHTMHRTKYSQLKLSGFDNLKQLQVVVVEKLFYKYVIKKIGSAPMKRYECKCLLQGNVLYTTAESDSHTLFLELSRLFFNGAPDLYMANFLHMITTMIESGSTKEQIEFFIVNSQKIPKLPDEESVLSLSSIPPSMGKYESIHAGATPVGMNEGKASNFKRKPGNGSNWPPLDWRTAPAHDYALLNLKTKDVVGQPSSPHETDEVLKTQVERLHPNVNEDDLKEIITQAYSIVPSNIEANWTVEEDSSTLPSEAGKMDSHLAYSGNQPSDPGDLNIVSDGPSFSTAPFSMRDQLHTGAPNATQALLTGRLGERVAFQYLTGKFGNDAVKWVNQQNETGLPYDIIIGEHDSIEYIEVKATRSARKDWFKISTREWQFAHEMGEAFSICHVHFGNSLAQVTIFRNPVKQCQHGKLQLVVMMPNTPLRRSMLQENQLQ